MQKLTALTRTCSRLQRKVVYILLAGIAISYDSHYRTSSGQLTSGASAVKYLITSNLIYVLPIWNDTCLCSRRGPFVWP